jgi:plastocyanin
MFTATINAKVWLATIAWPSPVSSSSQRFGGGSFRFSFHDAGEYAFFCTIHPTMTGSITVTG